MIRIGLTQRVEVVSHYKERRDALDQNWSKLVLELGWVPVVLPNVTPPNLEYLLAEYNLDGVILTGGNSLQSVAPEGASVAPERDEFEQRLLSFCLERDIPVLGICRGMQLISLYFGGKLERVSGHVAVRHELQVISDDEELPSQVNSFHEWAIPSSTLSSELTILASDKNNYVEAFKHNGKSLFGIMWHPEREAPYSNCDLNFLRRIFL